MSSPPMRKLSELPPGRRFPTSDWTFVPPWGSTIGGLGLRCYANCQVLASMAHCLSYKLLARMYRNIERRRSNRLPTLARLVSDEAAPFRANGFLTM